MGNPHTLRGIIVPMVTPLTPSYQVDIESTQRLVEYLLGQGAHGLFVGGTMGEGPALRLEQKEVLVHTVVTQVRNRCPVIPVIAGHSNQEIIKGAIRLAQTGAGLLGIMQPYFFPRRDPDYLLNLMGELSTTLSMDLLFYHNPVLTNYPLEGDTMRRILEQDRVHALKDSSGRASLFHHLVELGKTYGVEVFQGDESQIAGGLFYGAAGAIAGISTVFPKIPLKIYQASLKEDYIAALRLQERLNRLLRQLYGEKNKHWLTATKYALQRLGVISSDISLTYPQLGPRGKYAVDRLLAEGIPAEYLPGGDRP